MGVQEHLDGVGGAGQGEELEIVQVRRRVDYARSEAEGDGRSRIDGVIMAVEGHKVHGNEPVPVHLNGGEFQVLDVDPAPNYCGAF